ncbi:hypothetical protein [Anaerorhabdus furcosa]|uniref:Uncharacterized protein n=1 Tax=Anaerorhabdus furcosa TaxID=118967 RepID=A0A1T4PSF0_9FIRM|nr:hypothetical protein [Anaerorhabdus furcosa]SJZ94473.1 hypothetical protein SAMN02745191_2137 [Anaerorhabdus furcosa]
MKNILRKTIISAMTFSTLFLCFTFPRLNVLASEQNELKFCIYDSNGNLDPSSPTPCVPKTRAHQGGPI